MKRNPARKRASARGTPAEELTVKVRQFGPAPDQIQALTEVVTNHRSVRAYLAKTRFRLLRRANGAVRGNEGNQAQTTESVSRSVLRLHEQSHDLCNRKLCAAKNIRGHLNPRSSCFLARQNSTKLPTCSENTRKWVRRYGPAVAIPTAS